MRSVPHALAAVLFLALAAPPAAPAQDPPSAPPLDPAPLAAAGEAARWVARQAIDGAKGKTVRFPEYAESPGERPTSPLYAGSAGVLVFLENAAALLDDDDLRALADRTAAGLLEEKPGKVAGLYTGDAGTAWALLVRWRLRKDRAALAGARRLADGLLSRMKMGGDGGSWGGNLDVISGAAGTALLLLEVAADTGEKKYAEAARRAGRFLAGEGIAERAAPPSRDRLLRWPAAVGQKRHYLNFSHGTAGVAYALARVAGATGDKVCREAALAGGRWLLAHAKREDGTTTWCHSLPGGEENFVEGWCHGPAGTGRTMLLLHSLTGERQWFDAALGAAAWVMEEKPPGEETKYYSPSLCCGAAGVVDFFVDAYRATGDPAHRAYARAAGEALLRLSKKDGDGRKWTNYDRPDENGVVHHGVSLMLGTSGEGLALLRLAAIDRAEDPVVSLPDRTVAVAAPPK